MKIKTLIMLLTVQFSLFAWKGSKAVYVPPQWDYSESYSTTIGSSERLKCLNLYDVIALEEHIIAVGRFKDEGIQELFHPVIVTFDTLGNLLSKQVDTQHRSGAYTGITVEDSNLVIVGYTSNELIESGDTGVVFLKKVSTDGALLWEKKLGYFNTYKNHHFLKKYHGEGFKLFYSAYNCDKITEYILGTGTYKDSVEQHFLVRDIDSWDTNFDYFSNGDICYTKRKVVNEVGDTFTKGEVIRETITGDTVWTKEFLFSKGTKMFPKDVLVTSGDSIFVVGTVLHTGGIDIDERRGFLYHFDGDGELVWDTTLNGGSEEELVSITPRESGGYLLSGYYIHYETKNVRGVLSIALKEDLSYDWTTKAPIDGNIELSTIVSRKDGALLLCNNPRASSGRFTALFSFTTPESSVLPHSISGGIKQQQFVIKGDKLHLLPGIEYERVRLLNLHGQVLQTAPKEKLLTLKNFQGMFIVEVGTTANRYRSKIVLP